MQIATASEARQNFAEVLGRVAYGKERVTIERRGKPLAVLVPIEDLALLEGRTEEGLRKSEELLRSIVSPSYPIRRVMTATNSLRTLFVLIFQIKNQAQKENK